MDLNTKRGEMMKTNYKKIECEITESLEKELEDIPYSIDELIRLGLYAISDQELEEKRRPYMDAIEVCSKNILENIYKMREF